MKILILFFAFLLPLGLMAQTDVEEYNRGVAVHSSDPFAATKHYTKCLAINPKHSNAYYNRALLHFNNNQYDKALEDCSNALKYDDKHAAAYGLRGLCYKQKENIDKAIQDFSKEIKYLTDKKIKATAYFNRAWTYSMQLKNKEKLADLQKAVELQPENIEYQYECGRAKFEVGGEVYESAIKNFTKVIELDPKHKEAYTERATYNMTFQHFKEALADLKIAKKMGADVDHLLEAAKFELEMQED